MGRGGGREGGSGWKDNRDVYRRFLLSGNLTVDNDKLLVLTLPLLGQALLDLGQTRRAGGGQRGEEGGEGEGLRRCLMMEIVDKSMARANEGGRLGLVHVPMLTS